MSRDPTSSYSVSFRGGTRGDFLTAMIVYILSDFTDDIDFKKSVFCFDYYLKWRSENIDRSAINGYLGAERHGIDVFSKSKIYDTSKTNFLAANFIWQIPSFDELYKIHRDFKHIVVTCKTEDLLKAEANYFYQQKVEGMIRKRNHFWNTYNTLKDKNLLLNNVVNNLDELSLFDVKLLLKAHMVRESNMPGDTLRLHPDYDQMVDSKVSIPEQYLSNISLIDFNDIIDDKEKTLDLLSYVTDKVISKDAERNYDRYVNLQKQIHETYVSKILMI